MIELCIYLLLNLCVDYKTDEVISCDRCQQIIVKDEIWERESNESH